MWVVNMDVKWCEYDDETCLEAQLARYLTLAPHGSDDDRLVRENMLDERDPIHIP